jgi:hypothetical protein
MEPVDSDFFKSVDYNSTFQILDAVPGTLPVANLAALQALTWGTAQHGTRVLQLDNGAEWYWYNPSGAGVWKRTNNVGLVTSAIQSADVSTTLTSTGPTFIQTPTFTAPGVRTLRIDLRVGLDNTSGQNGIGIITLLDNGTSLLDWNIRCGSYLNGNGVGFLNSIFIANPAAGSTHQVSARVRSAIGSVGNGASGTTVVRYSVLTVTEV